MDIGIGLPNTVPGCTRDDLLDWAPAAEEAGFSSVATLDRLVYPGIEALVALSAAASSTKRVGLVTDVILGPLRGNPALLAKQILSLDSLAGGGRAVLGIGLGAREDDYEVSGVDLSTRGAWLDEALEKIRAVWDGEGELEKEIGPRPQNGSPTLLVGGYVDASVKRASRFGDGWTQGGSGPDQFSKDIKKLHAAWEAAGREGKPRTMSLVYFSLGPDAEANARRDLLHYYAWLGDEAAEGIANSAATDAESVQGYISNFEQYGCDELIFFPCSTDPAQVRHLAEAAGL